MRTAGRVAAAGTAVVVLLGGYAALDVYDKVPGVLTTTDAQRDPVPVPGHTAPPPAASAAPPVVPKVEAVAQAADAPVPAPAKVSALVSPLLKSRYLGPTTALTIRDGRTGQHLMDVDADGAHTPASITKMLSAYAIARTLDLGATLDTTVVESSGGSVVLVAGGDTVLNPGSGDPNAVTGRAGLDDLAAQVAKQLKAQGRTSTTVGYDVSYAPGPLQAAHWAQGNVDSGYTARIAMLGLSTQRAHPGTPPPKDPARSTAQAFVKALAGQGISATLGGTTTAAEGAARLGVVHSAPIVDVLGVALQDSDNAMVESLARQAAAKAGRPGDTASVVAWITDTLKRDGIDLRGVRLADASGLGDGTTIPARVLGDLIVRATSGKSPRFEQVVSRLPVAGLNGTVHDRFGVPDARAGVGVVRAKTGSLPSVTSLTGTVLDKDGRLLAFTLINNGKQPRGPLDARAQLDRVVAALAGCGCR
ncbi:D-alanyl-D-alanine carboxypeptidase/D-alanyl-D-alanine endopeptidase [Luteipulveratus flavus]|uniref:D-alanyl-D-alanine carboxypeptidase/D-alanyl-D-alanine-endopeptidase n=1 Tax=Luteipulveratus flavus TaxID=3031728 RepID=A0ABT6C9J9_9MICO|nr:D-alanyl-D-alanine carboxypeptidase/D-alanyl-D-alanine-endopeptidase [Luteipulveratus sp. YIM 133296]MDF8264729.1 D-alanyl-D-alanine carboxypeptidase/D-alanyl-D-alanine-endopeptidase [Luteipulveratus sp. YIM 133296]